MAPRRRVDHGVGHRETERERDIGRLQSERRIDRNNRRSPKRRDGLEGSLFRDVSADHLVDLVDLDRGDEQGFPALEVGSEAARQRSVGEVLDPAA